MFGSLSTALSALSATSSAIDVVGNNLANLNTTGFKQNTVSFFEMMNSAGFNGLGTAAGIVLTRQMPGVQHGTC